jgi:hypothetical protein
VRYAFELLLQIVLAGWVYQDARKRDWHGDRFADTPWKWGLGAFFLWIMVVPVYLLRRGKRPLLGEEHTAA